MTLARPKPPVDRAEIHLREVAIARDPATPLLRSQELFGEAREILIEHCGGFYRLRITHSNKLILTK